MRTALALLALGWTHAAAQTPPVARVAPAQDSYHGQVVIDPYRWMEDRGEDFTAWARAQDGAARKALDAVPARPVLAKQIADFSAASVTAGRAQLAAGRVFYLRRPPAGAQPALYVRALAGGPDRILVDPDRLSRPGAPVAIQSYTPSPDGRYVAYSLSEGGSEDSVLHVLETDNGKILPEAMDRARFADPAWDPERPEFYYARIKAARPGEAPAERFKDESIWRHRVGDDPSRDTPVFDVAAQKGAGGRDGIPGLLIPRGSAWAIALINSGVSATGELYVADLPALRAGKPAWRRIVSNEDLILQVSITTQGRLPPVVVGSSLYLGSTKDAPRGKIVRLDLARPGAPVTVAPEQAGVLIAYAPAADGLYLTYALGGRYDLRRLDPKTGRLSAVKIPYPGAISEVDADAARPGAVFSLESWGQPRRLFAVAGGAVRDLKLSNPFPFDLSQVAVDEITITARDGTKVPVSILRRADSPRDGKAPAIIEAYGAYGISADPYFDPRWIPWVLRGGVYATVHARGGGEFGEAWWKAGFQATKPNTWRDFIDAVEALKTLGYAAPDRVVGLGTSAGGIAIGRAVTERPDLFAGAIANVPISDALRFELTEGGPANVTEFGSVKTPEGFKALQAMSPYEHVEAGGKYPALLVTAAMNDHRVPAWQPAKLAARLQAATGSGKPVLFRVAWDAGHGVGSTKTQRDDLYADFYAFALMATGGYPP